MPIQLSQSPATPFDMAYGANPVTLTGITPSQDKYVLQLFRNGQIIGDLRQAANAQNCAVFDIQNVLQNFVAPSPSNVEEIGFNGDPLLNSNSETCEYVMKWGSETGGQPPVLEGAQQIRVVFGGTKPYYEYAYQGTQFIPVIQTFGPCTSIQKPARVFSDYANWVPADDITDGKPSWLTGNKRVYNHYVTVDDMTTISYYNKVSLSNNVPTNAKSIEAFLYWQYDANDQLIGGGPDIVYNTQFEGGGPNSVPGAGTTVNHPYYAITASTGPRNFQDFTPSTCKYYYVTTAVYTYPNGCTSEITGLADGSLHDVHRFNIIEGECNDYSSIQVSWLNSYGFRDYYTFRKRHDRNIAIKRNNYLREAADYNSGSYTVNINQRGTTTYSQTLEQEFTAFTGFLSDAEALFLEKLFISPDVKVRFEGENGDKWVPVTLINTTYTEKTVRKDKLFQYDIKFKIAHNIKSQRG
jgi:hypothetical protein